MRRNGHASSDTAVLVAPLLRHDVALLPCPRFLHQHPVCTSHSAVHPRPALLSVPSGSGKTFTITGLHKLVARDVFRAASADAFAGLGLAVHVSFLEIYGARCVDLLHGRAKVSILEDAKQVSS